MKARLLFLFLCLAWSGWADTFTPYSPDSLKKGDWMTFESVHYYSYVAPGIEEEIPWRAENIRRISILATVTDKTEKSISIDYTLKNIYDCHNNRQKGGFYYFDSRYRQDFASKDSMSGKKILQVTYDRKSREITELEESNSLYTYPKTFIPFGVRQAGLSDYKGTFFQNSIDMDKLLTPIAKKLLTGWEKDGTMVLSPK